MLSLLHVSFVTVTESIGPVLTVIGLAGSIASIYAIFKRQNDEDDNQSGYDEREWKVTYRSTRKRKTKR
jgi:hypothetical protein